jgi:hypothetical protein
MKRSSSWLQNGCLITMPVLRLGTHPEMERPAMREQINALYFWCDHEHPRLTSGASVFPNTNGLSVPAMRKAIYNF